MDQFIDQYQVLYNKARADLSAAQILLNEFNKNDSELDLDTIYFHLQQCAEKLLKSILSKNGINYPKIHDIERLFELLEDNNIGLNTNQVLLSELSDFAVEGRYAIINDNLFKTEEYISELNSLTTKVKDLLND
jgi:HEPN domain-containing protein